MLLLTHHLGDSDMQVIRQSRLPVCVHVSLRDRLIPPHQQFLLAKELRAKLIITDGGHMGDCEDPQKFRQEMLHHFQSSA